MNEDVLKFYNLNKDCVYTPPVLPDNLSTVDAARWIMNHPDFAWLELDMPVPDLEYTVAESYYVSHREGESSGWDSCCIHGIETWATQNWPEYVAEETDSIYKWTTIADHAPITDKFWKTFPSEKFKRVRFMRLAPGGYIASHSDAPGRGYRPGEPVDYDPLELGCPVNIAIIHPDDCHMVLERFGVVPFKPNKMFLVNIRHTHAVLNFSNQERVHMIGFCVFGDRKEQFADLIVKSYGRI
jgi:hypothetical protein